MNIGITVFPTYGGSGIVGSELGRELAERGHSVHFISYALPTRLCPLDERLQFHQVDLFDYPLFEFPPYDLALASKILEVADAQKLDVLHMHYAIPHATAAYLAREMYKPKRYLPFVTTLHGTDITLVGSRKSFLPITKFSIAQSDAVTSISQYLADETCRTFGLGGIEIIPNFINAQDYQRRDNPALKAELAPRGEKLLIHVSNFRPVKRIEDCIHTLAKIRAAAKHLLVRLVMCGDGPKREGAEQLARSYGLADDVLFVGQVPNIADYLSVADLLLIPSETESFGLAALEALACEVPVIATRVGGLPEVVLDGENGYLVGLGDTTAMAEHAIEILSDETRQQCLGKSGREWAVGGFNTDRVIPMYERLYERVLTAPRKSGALIHC
ncbi:MAG TPA: N-acetyl-alpha-D-glucosaminyl L-malate synthase BshA [Blastocatellia bacterium]|nr:N-acetyl-alpha-D-glucosaminyl L-malate synthase BshA [Blastocatellia bacterium]HMX24601.1 N-acetyl-alpha-D-glucosaminyl L-malate synthase BshA [Blastocatellia bacterium]HMZ16667.1 N-acetyl-alpha-D-glucosaminyl L-malate synthase BshA [Blastocatellia bacterium]HNG33882.1 N-acetyl-alpha-D-glucosaminyl L-malate synthase BshA [Blastocatellia bacterium]